MKKPKSLMHCLAAELTIPEASLLLGFLSSERSYFSFQPLEFGFVILRAQTILTNANGIAG